MDPSAPQLSFLLLFQAWQLPNLNQFPERKKKSFFFSLIFYLFLIWPLFSWFFSYFPYFFLLFLTFFPIFVLKSGRRFYMAFFSVNQGGGGVNYFVFFSAQYHHCVFIFPITISSLVYCFRHQIRLYCMEWYQRLWIWPIATMYRSQSLSWWS